jgi:hypothetical protein
MGIDMSSERDLNLVLGLNRSGDELVEPAGGETWCWGDSVWGEPSGEGTSCVGISMSSARDFIFGFGRSGDGLLEGDQRHGGVGLGVS